MTGYIVRRFIQTLIVLIIVAFFTFMILHFIPGDPVITILGLDATPTEVAALRHELGLDLALPVQFGNWFLGVLHGDFGTSIIRHLPVSNLISQSLPITLYLAFLALIISTFLGVAGGIISAIKRGGALDSFITLFANVGVATPSFWLGILFIYFFGLQFRLLPIQGFVWPNVDVVKHIKLIILPVICLSYGAIALMARQTRSSMLEVIRQDYIRTAKSKGLQEKTVVYKHALKNALIPVVTLLGMYIPLLVGGSVLVETIFNIPGMGRLLVTAAFDRDYPILQAGVLLIGVVVGLVNLAVDISYGWLDPRIRYE